MAKSVVSNPCGLSFDKIVDVINNNVRHGQFNSRQEVMDSLILDGFSYEEAKEISDFYYKIYNRLAENKKVKAPGITLTGKERLDKKIRNLAVDYLNGKVGTFDMTDKDFDHLAEIYEKEESADTPTLKAKYADEAAVFIQQFMPGYTDELFRSFVYAKPLLSGVFFIKSLISNFAGQIERGLFNIWDGKKLDFTALGDTFKKSDDKLFHSDLANASAVNVLKGGIPASTLFQAESGFDPTRGRVEEFGIKGTAADANKVKATYYRAINFLSKWSNRFNASPDTRGIFHNAERHFYQLSKEYYRSEGYDEDAATQAAMKDMELDDIKTATDMAETKFKELGLEAYDQKGKPTSEFKVAVAEYRRLGREETRWKDAMQLAKNDFWKKNMMLPTKLGFGDTGLFGLKAQVIVKLRDLIEKKTKNKLASAFNLSAFGFINGAANFAEDALERVPPYAAIKLAFLQAKKKDITDASLQNDLLRRQRDLIAKNIATFAFFAASKIAEKLICGDNAGRETSAQIAGGRTQIGVCGVPAVVPPQMLATYKWYRLIDAAAKNDDEFVNTALNMWPILVQSNNVGLGGAADKVGTATLNYAQALKQGNAIRASEEKQKIINTAMEYGVGVGNSFLPIPSRAVSEVSVGVQHLRGFTQQQQKLPFATDEVGNRLGFFQTAEKISLAAMGNVTGIQDISIAALGSKKEYAMDWLGRKVMQFRGTDIAGDGIKYEQADDILATAGVPAPYLYRLQKVEAEKDAPQRGKIMGVQVVEQNSKDRYLTDHEYFIASKALADFNKEFFHDNAADLIDLVKEDKPVANKFITSVFTSTKKAALEAIEKGFDNADDINGYIWKNWKPDRGMRISNKKTD